MNNINLLDIHSPADIKKMSVGELTVLAAEMRAALIRRLAARGGHAGPNLGMVEAIIALHYVFDAPADKLVFDISHQTYPHKMLTGRMEAFVDPAHYNDVTGYTAPSESPGYDLFSTGHTSTSISLATGLAKARDLRGGKENVVAVIGDGSLGGGMALEGLDNGSVPGTNFIVVVNDNDMSIAENHGGMYAGLAALRNSNGTAPDNIFRTMGYDYLYVHYGNDIERLIKAFEAVKDTDGPVVVHINTMKGLGLPVAEANKEAFHYTGPFNPESGAPLSGPSAPEADYGDIFATHMLALIESGAETAVLTAGTPGAIGFGPERRRMAGNRFVDVGICEQQAVGMAAGMAKGGVRPVFGVVASFLQRAYDQLSHDVAINGLPVVFNVCYTGIDGMTDETHLGFFDIPLISNIPAILYLAPTCRQEYVAMLDWAVRQTSRPVAVRVPAGAVVSDPDFVPADDYSVPRYDISRRGSRAAIIGVGATYPIAAKAADLLADKGIYATLINPRNVSELDTDTLDSLADYDIVLTLEDGVLDGGYGQKVAAYLAGRRTAVHCTGLPKVFRNRFRASELMAEAGLTPEAVAAKALEYVQAGQSER